MNYLLVNVSIGDIFNDVGANVNIENIYSVWRSAKRTLQFEGMYTSNELHVYVGLVIYGFAFYLFRHTKFPALKALFFVAVLQFFNEILDSALGMYMHTLPNFKLTVLDCVLTLVVPGTLTFIYFALTKTGLLNSVRTNELTARL